VEVLCPLSRPGPNYGPSPHLMMQVQFIMVIIIVVLALAAGGLALGRALLVDGGGWRGWRERRGCECAVSGGGVSAP
jgi:hypothetical protein